MIVIDVGCARYGGDYSLERLAEEFQPDVLYGFDPNPVLEQPEIEIFEHSPAMKVVLERRAAWTFDGEVGYREDGLNSWVTDDPRAPKVPCFDLARFIVELDQNDIVLKIDAEGAEYDLLFHLIERRADALLKLAWVEFHQPDRGRAKIEKEIACPLQEWRW